MASKNGPMVDGTDGSDFKHRQKVAGHYQQSAVNKSRFQNTITCHRFLSLIMLLKLIPDIIDRLDIFILELEELYIPHPNRWEYIWLFSAFFTMSGLNAAKKNAMGSLQFYLFGLVSCSILPLVYAGVFYFREALTYLQTGEVEGLETWRGLPLALLWYGFIVFAIQVHLFSMYFAYQLMLSWKPKVVSKLETNGKAE